MRRLARATTVLVAIWSCGAAAQTELCEDPGKACGEQVSASCLSRLGAGSVAAAEDPGCAEQLSTYRDCLASVATECAATPGQSADAACDSATALALWASAERDNDCLGYRSFRDACPSSAQARFVESRLQRLGCGEGAAAASAEEPSQPPSQSGVDVKAAQRELKRLQLYSGPIDGDWGPGSQQAMERFKRQAGMVPVDGVLTLVGLEEMKRAPTPALAPKGPRPEQTADLGTFKECDACPTMVAIPGGVFQMGSPSGERGRKENEGPVRRVSVARFALARTEITFDQFEACAADGGCIGYRPKDEGWGRGAHPALNVSWEDAQAYARWLNSKVPGAPYRLPSEAEWEYAARAGSTGRYSWGDSASHEHANYGKDGCCGGEVKGRDQWEFTAPVGSFPPNDFGLHDMSGNLWEVVDDCWSESHSGAPDDGAARRSGDCSNRPIRGGSWDNQPDRIRSAARDGARRDRRYRSMGFRIARSLDQ